MPVAQVIGKVAQTGAERIIGTLVGGTLGFITYKVGRLYWDPDTRSDGVRLLKHPLFRGPLSALLYRLRLTHRTP